MKFIIFFLFIGTVSFLANAEKMDLSTTDLVITKLTKSIAGQSIHESKEISLRLADLYAERARLKNMDEHERNCVNCLGSKQDKIKALNLYFNLFHRFNSSTQERLVMQISHLSISTGQNRRASRLFNQILKARKYSKKVKARVLLSNGQSQFSKGNYKMALKNFDEAIRKNPKLKTPFVLYRIGWCHFNIGNLVTAEAILLKIARSQANSPKNLLFLEDVTKDFAMFISRRPITNSQINRLSQISPESTKKINLIFLANELARHGKSAGFIKVYTFIEKNYTLTQIERAEYQLQGALSSFSIGHKKSASVSFEKSLNETKKIRCRSIRSACEKLQKKQMEFLVSWNKEEKLEPSRSLQNSYAKYAEVYPEDFQTSFWAAQLAHQRGDLKTAHKLYRQVSLRSKKSDSSLAKNLLKQSLNAEIAVAESSGKVGMRQDSYRSYLAINPEGSHAIEARYQLAYIRYENKDFDSAFSQFLKIAQITPRGLKPPDRSFLIKSADLSLDCLAAKRDNLALIKWSNYFARMWPAKRSGFNVIKRRAILNHANLLLKKKDSDQDYLKEVLTALRSISFRDVKDHEQIALLTTQILVAERVRDFKELNRVSRKILSMKSAKTKDRKFALRQLIWVAEAHFNFKTAYKLTQRLGRDRLSESSHILRLALLADLAKLNPEKHYNRYLKKYPYGRQANKVRASLVLKNRRPWRKLAQFERQLARSPRLFANVTLEVFAKNRNITKVKKLSKQRRFRQTSAGQILQRHIDYFDFFVAQKSVRVHRIKSRSDRQLKRSLAKRIQLISILEKKSRRFMIRKEWGLQVLVLASLSREYNRLKDNLLKLPIPRGLNKEERKRYQQALKVEAKPYQLQASAIDKKLDSLWDSDDYVEYLGNNKNDSNFPLSRLWAYEATYLATAAPRSKIYKLRKIAKSPKINRSKIYKAQLAIKADPFSQEKMEDFKELVSDIGDPSMSTFISARLESLKKEKVQ